MGYAGKYKYLTYSSLILSVISAVFALLPFVFIFFVIKEVIEVAPNYSQVRSIIDDESNISGMILSTSDLCMVRGDLKLMEDGRIRLEKLPNNDTEIEVGEQVVTSHISSRFLQGLLIGYVSEISVDSNNLTRSGYITPAVDFTKLHEVLIITSTKQDMIDAKELIHPDSILARNFLIESKNTSR